MKCVAQQVVGAGMSSSHYSYNIEVWYVTETDKHTSQIKAFTCQWETVITFDFLGLF